jgi:hypothetical protein
MAGRTRSHSEERWALLPETIVRCNATRPNGGRCKREAEPGSVVCDQHGGAAPQVRRRAAERVLLNADEAIQVIKSFISDPTVPAGVRLKTAQDLADRAGLAATQLHKIIPSNEDPVIAFFEGLLSDPGALVDTSPPGPRQPAIEAYAVDPPKPDAKPEMILVAEIVDDQPSAVSGDDTPARIRQMIQQGAFDRKPGQ